MTTHDLILSGGQVLLPGVGLKGADILVSDGCVTVLAGPASAAKSRANVRRLTELPGVVAGNGSRPDSVMTPVTPHGLAPK